MTAIPKYRIAVLMLLAALYLALTQSYRAYDIDNPWFQSFSYNYCHGDIQNDTFMQAHYPYGMDGVHLFGKIPAATQCLVMNRLGWTPYSIVPLNLVLGLAALWLWGAFLKRLGYSERWIAAYLLLLGLVEPFVSMMEKARFEPFVFFMLAMALWMSSRGWEIAAALVAMLSVEVEPAAVLVPILVIVVLGWCTRNRSLLALKLVASGIVVFALYVALHPGALHVIATTRLQPRQSVFQELLYQYFVERRRHLPELAMLVLGVVLFASHRNAAKVETRLGSRIAVSLAIVALIYMLALSHPNPSYQVLPIPFVLWLALEGYNRAPAFWRWVPALVFTGILAEYGYLVYLNSHEGFRMREFAAVSQQITASEERLALPDKQVRLCGDSSLWYAHPDGYMACLPASNVDIRSANLYLCFDGPLMPKRLSAPTLSCADLSRTLPLRELSSIVIRGHLLHFEVPR